MKDTYPLIEDLLQRFQPFIGADFDRYRNHVYRVFLNCLLLDTDKSNTDKYAIAAVFHDIGIWTDHTFDYLAPSVNQARLYLAEIDKLPWSDEISLMIDWHHKVGVYRNKFAGTVETFRRADWTDVSLGLLTFGVDSKKLNANKKEYPLLGFHGFLIKATANNFLKHPLNPLPMFKR